jgi:RHS repeat-associated protein
VDEPLVTYEGAGLADKRYLHADERGSIVAVSNASGTVTAINSYDDYGIPKSTNPAAMGRFGYTGQAWLPEIGLSYYKNRVYSPTLGRFMQSDPIGYGDGVNLYAYVKGDPINFSDPLGLEGEEIEEIVVTGTRAAKPKEAAPIVSGGAAFNFIFNLPSSGLSKAVAEGGESLEMEPVATFTCTANRERHEQAVARIGLEYLAAGKIVTPNVTFTNPISGLSASADLVVSNPAFPLPDPFLIIEVKTGKGKLERGQPDVYGLIAGSKGIIIPRGFNALRAGFIPGVGVDVGPLNFSLRREPGKSGC